MCRPTTGRPAGSLLSRSVIQAASVLEILTWISYYYKILVLQGHVMVLGKDCDAYPNLTKYAWSQFKKYSRWASLLVVMIHDQCCGAGRFLTGSGFFSPAPDPTPAPPSAPAPIKSRLSTLFNQF